MKEESFLKRRKQTTEHAIANDFGPARGKDDFFETSIDLRRRSHMTRNYKSNNK